MPSLYKILVFALPAVIVLAAIEAFILAVIKRRPYDWRASLASLADALGRQYVVYVFLPASLAAPLIGWAATHRIATVPLNSVAAFAVLFLGQEFCYYWFHRASHRVRWFWATHAVHHSPGELNLSAAYRFGLTGRLTGSAAFYTPLIWLGFPVDAVFATLSLNLLYQFWLHTDYIPKLGWLEYMLNTPSHHRVHHAANPEYLDANYGGVLIIFDRLFGTLIVEREDLPCRFGLVKPLTSRNPIVIAFHEWVALGRDLLSARSLREVFFYLFGPPGWRPDGKGLTTEALRRAAAESSAVPAGAAAG
jgi:sterol desaturase/sphingolipid hydroxylase (fatty acid hydroxylase superfamily)